MVVSEIILLGCMEIRQNVRLWDISLYKWSLVQRLMEREYAEWIWNLYISEWNELRRRMERPLNAWNWLLYN